MDAHSDFESFLVISTHGANGILMCSILSGNTYHGNKLTPVLPTATGIKVTQGTPSLPLIVEPVYFDMKFYFVPLGLFYKKINLEIQKS